MVEFVVGRISYVEIRGRWCDIIAANAHAPTARLRRPISMRNYNMYLFS